MHVSLACKGDMTYVNAHVFSPLTDWIKSQHSGSASVQLPMLLKVLAMAIFLQVLWEVLGPPEESSFYAARCLEELFLRTADVTCNKTNTHNVL